MSKHLEKDLDRLQQDIVSMGAAVEEAIYKATRALQGRQVGTAEEVIDGDRQIDEDENRVEEECLKMLALHQPVAVDLRRIVTALKINTDLERIADHATNVAEGVIYLVEGEIVRHRPSAVEN